MKQTLSPGVTLVIILVVVVLVVAIGYFVFLKKKAAPPPSESENLMQQSLQLGPNGQPGPTPGGGTTPPSSG